MRIIVVFALALLSVATSAAAEDKGGMKAALTFMAAGQAADLVTTVQALNRGAVEANPLYGKQPSTAKLVAAKLPMVGLGYLLHRIAPRNPKLAKGLAYAIGGVGVGLAVSNSRKGKH
jgi:hypothetical protein